MPPLSPRLLLPIRKPAGISTPSVHVPRLSLDHHYHWDRRQLRLGLHVPTLDIRNAQLEHGVHVVSRIHNPDGPRSRGNHLRLSV